MTRERAITLIKSRCPQNPRKPWGVEYKNACEMAIQALKQEPKTGHWIRGKYTEDDIRYNDSSYECSECDRVVDFKENFCPRCGAKMVEPQESEEKNDKNNMRYMR